MIVTITVKFNDYNMGDDQ